MIDNQSFVVPLYITAASALVGKRAKEVVPSKDVRGPHDRDRQESRLVYVDLWIPGSCIV